MIQIEREYYLYKIFSRLNSSTPQSISVTGDRKIGKTMILNDVVNKEMQKKYLDPSKTFLFYYKDLNGFKDDHLALLQDIVNVFSGHSTVTTSGIENVYSQLRAIVSSNINNYSHVIILDNFDCFTQNPLIPIDFYSSLRSLANNYRVGYVISSLCDFSGPCIPKKLAGSPFFNIFENIDIRPFTISEEEKLLALYENRLPREMVRQLSGLHPFLMSQVVDFLTENVNQESIEGMKEILVKRNRVFADELVKQCYPVKYHEIFISLAKGVSPSVRELYMANNLMAKGYIDEEYKFRSEILRSAIAEMNVALLNKL